MADKFFGFLEKKVSDLLILDIMLYRGMDGLEIRAKIKGRARIRRA